MGFSRKCQFSYLADATSGSLGRGGVGFLHYGMGSLEKQESIRSSLAKHHLLHGLDGFSGVSEISGLGVVYYVEVSQWTSLVWVASVFWKTTDMERLSGDILMPNAGGQLNVQGQQRSLHILEILISFLKRSS